MKLLWLYLDAEVLVLPPVFLPQDSVFVGRRLRRHPTRRGRVLQELDDDVVGGQQKQSLGNTPPRSTV